MSLTVTATRPNVWLLAPDCGYLNPTPRAGWITTFGDGTKPPVTLYVFPRHVGIPKTRSAGSRVGHASIACGHSGCQESGRS